uniref:Aspartyl protease n=2 Tax=unclassified Candidatus Kentrum TaxID=2643149 RepID=A0A451AKG7_9GAMM|nr:MAG: Aspartyl protease [Candidatus Kentron sp. LPFa]VFK16319.1 MAG: Aspartyl protease [Candidatus Kentron sp. LPFa]VFK31644.1 MAG: Aspartyl protease [Candidatus Kentron sp. LPFa]VFK66473.1 MAG: Aspartyl protease [Candidatus Kentron sp. UNK]VFK71679.1 MAG: Aspartyl protease [Candidatus Kentron sp. UNK]
MGRIVTSVTISNGKQKLRIDALVDTGASHMVLPSAWRERLGELEEIDTVFLETATQKTESGTVCGPVKLQIEGFRPIFTEVIFIDMEPEHGEYEPLIGYIPLEQSQVAVDMLGHRLVHVKRLDLK